MSATIHYLRPFERQDLSKTEAEPAPAAETMSDEQGPAVETKSARKRTMPCGRKSRFKKRMDGTVVPREER